MLQMHAVQRLLAAVTVLHVSVAAHGYVMVLDAAVLYDVPTHVIQHSYIQYHDQQLHSMYASTRIHAVAVQVYAMVVYDHSIHLYSSLPAGT